MNQSSTNSNPIIPVEETSQLVNQNTDQSVHWSQIGIFLGVTFGLTWLLNLALYLAGGLTHPAASIVLQLQMLLPAFSAILLGTFFFKNSPLHFHSNHTLSRWFVYYYLLLTLAYIGAAVWCLIQPAETQILSPIMLIPCGIGLILLIVLRLVGGKQTFAGVGMAGGKPLLWLLFGVAFILFYAGSMLLNMVFKLGHPVDLLSLPMYVGTSTPVWLLMVSLMINTMLIGPFLGLIIAFGEEYGWRGYLQSELSKLGRIKGTFLIGVIWGIWHWPVIWMGYNYPGQPVLGSLLMVLYTIFLAFILAYAVFKAQGIWISGFLHALNNQVLSFFFLFVYTPASNIMAFGTGFPSIVIYIVILAIILRDPVWKQKGFMIKTGESMQ